MTNTFCPTCGYNLGFLPWEGDSPSDEICPSCGTQFGYDDMIRTSGDTLKTSLRYSELRKKWIQGGMQYWSTASVHPKPIDWDPKQQLKNIGVFL